MKGNTKKAFTISEIIIATFISVIILSFIFIFISNIIGGISKTNKEVKVMSSFYDFTQQLNNYRNVYTTGSILINNISESDIFLMKDITGNNGMLFGPVNLHDRKLNTDTISYGNKGVGFRRISADEIAEILVDNDVIFNYSFQSDQIFSDLKIQYMSLESYNSGKITDLNLVLDMDYQSSMAGKMRVNIPKDQLRKFNIDF